MKSLTPQEKFMLIRDHGERLKMAGMSLYMNRRSEVIESAQRIVELAKSIPKTEWASES